MSKLWKLILGIVLAVLVLGAVGSAGFIAGRRSALWTVARRPGPSRPLEVRLIDDNKDGIPDRGMVEMPAGQASPDMWGRPRPGGVNPAFGPGRGEPFGRDFRPDQRRPIGLFFTPFLFIGGLVRSLVALGFLALLASLAVYLYHRWQPAQLAAAPAAVTPTPGEVQLPPAQTPAEDQTIHEG